MTKVGKDNKTLVKPLDVIFKAMWGLRVFQPVGIKKDVSEDITELDAQEIEDIDEAVERIFWKWNTHDWVNEDTGECLSGYVPSEAMNTLIDNMESG